MAIVMVKCVWVSMWMWTPKRGNAITQFEISTMCILHIVQTHAEREGGTYLCTWKHTAS